MEQFTDCALPDLLEDAMQVIAVLRWHRQEDDAAVRREASRVLARLYLARRDALEIGCGCCQRHVAEGCDCEACAGEGE